MLAGGGDDGGGGWSSGRERGDGGFGMEETATGPRKPLPRAALEELVLRLEEQPRLVEVWTSHNTMANLKVSLWMPQAGDLPDWVRKCKQRFCVGHYGHAGSYSAPKVTPLLPELEDTAVWQPFTKGDVLDIALDRFAPHPRSFRRAWQVHLPDPQPSFYAWQPIPPADSFVALGMVITKTDEPPSVKSVRCVHRALCCPARTKPQFLWNDRGVACGTAGSLWVVNNLHCVWATSSYEVPRGSAENGAFWEIKEWPLKLSQIMPPESPHHSPSGHTAASSAERRREERRPSGLRSISREEGEEAAAAAAASSRPSSSRRRQQSAPSGFSAVGGAPLIPPPAPPISSFEAIVSPSTPERRAAAGEEGTTSGEGGGDAASTPPARFMR